METTNSNQKLERNNAAFTFGPGVFSLADCRHGVLVHWWGLKERNDYEVMQCGHKWHIV